MNLSVDVFRNALRLLVRCTWGLAIVGAVTPAARAQSTVTMYGVLSTGINYTTNVGGKSQWQVGSGQEPPSRIGFKGREDLGGGNAAIFSLETGLAVNSGALLQGGRIFGRQAYVGLSSDTYGTVTFGRQYDEMDGSLWWAEAATLFGGYGTHIGDNDNIFGTQRLNNAVRYQSSSYQGFSFAGSYGFSNASAFADNRSISASVHYEKGPFRASLAFSQFDNPDAPSNASGAVDSDGWGFSSPFSVSPGKALTLRQRIVGAGGTYDLGFARIGAIYSNVLFAYLDGTGLRLQNAELNISRNIMPDLLIGAGYMYTAGSYSGGGSPHWNQVELGATYSLSKRTNLYVFGIYQKAGGSAQFAEIFNVPGASSTRSQASMSFGLRTSF